MIELNNMNDCERDATREAVNAARIRIAKATETPWPTVGRDEAPYLFEGSDD